MNAQLNPIFADLVNSFATASLAANQAQVDAYIVLLKSHDWEHEYADDGSVYRRGRAELDQLRMIQKGIDPRHEIWNVHAPERHRI